MSKVYITVASTVTWEQLGAYSSNSETDHGDGTATWEIDIAKASAYTLDAEGRPELHAAVKALTTRPARRLQRQHVEQDRRRMSGLLKAEIVAEGDIEDPTLAWRAGLASATKKQLIRARLSRAHLVAPLRKDTIAALRTRLRDASLEDIIAHAAAGGIDVSGETTKRGAVTLFAWRRYHVDLRDALDLSSAVEILATELGY